MKFDEVKEILKKCFGKEKDTRYHAIAMLVIYTFFFVILILFIRLSGANVQTNPNDTNQDSTSMPTISPSQAPDNNKSDVDENQTNNNTISNDINYSYSYTITYNGKSEVYLGKKIDDKEKFTLIKDGISTNYAILNDNYLIQKGDIYSITEKPSEFFKYCDVEKVLLLIKDKESSTTYLLNNSELKEQYNDILVVDNLKDNTIKITTSNNILKSVDLDFSNYYSSVTNANEKLIIHMEFADVGTTEDFEIKVS